MHPTRRPPSGPPTPPGRVAVLAHWTTAVVLPYPAGARTTTTAGCSPLRRLSSSGRAIACGPGVGGRNFVAGNIALHSLAGIT